MSPVCSPVCPGVRGAVMGVLLLSGLCSCLHQYYLIDEPKTWHKAQKHCREKYSDLATVANMQDVERLAAAAGGGHEGRVWIGLYDVPTRWLWSLMKQGFYGPGGANFRRWKAGEPNKTRRHGNLCVSFQQGYWYDHLCNKPFAFVCYNSTKTSDVSISSKERYVFINEKKEWFEAQAHCKEHYTDLVSVRNGNENALIQQAVPADQMVWIGLYRRSWVYWSDKTHSKFENWADGHPVRLQDSCAASVINATHLGQWVGNRCEDKHPFMCQNNKTQVFNVKLTALKSTIDLNDPAVTEGILTLIKEKLNKKGIKRDLKLAWIKKPEESIFHKEEENADVVKTDL